MSNKGIILVMTLIVLLMTMPLLAACDDDEEEPTEMPTPTPTETPTPTLTPTEMPTPTKPVDECTEETFKLGITGTVFGMTAESRDPSEEMAMDEINEAGGIRIGDTCVKFEYKFIDNKGTSAGAVGAVQSLLYEFKAGAVLDPGSAPVRAQVWRQYTEEEKVLGFAQTAPVYGWVGEEYPYTFHIHYDQAPEALFLIDWIAKNRPDIKKVHGIRQAQGVYMDQAKVVKKAALPEYGIEYTGTEFHDMQIRDFYPVLTSALKHKPDAIMCDYYSFNLLAKQARELGFKGTFLVVGAIPDYAFGMMKPEEINGTVSLTPSVESPLVPQYYKDYRESYHERQGGYPYSITTFPSYLLPYYIAAAIKAAGSTDSDKLKEVMETQTLTLEFPDGETLDVKMGGAEYYGINHAWSPPRYLSVVQNKKPEVMEVFTPEKIDQYMGIYMKYLEE